MALHRLASSARSAGARYGALVGLTIGLGAMSVMQEPPARAEARDRKPLGKPMMFVRDPDAFAKKWKKFSTDGIDRMLVIADFDFTLTTSFKPSGERGDSSHGVLMRSNSLDPAIGAAGREMFLKYYPIEQSPTLSNAEKLPFIIEWWTKEHDAIIKHKLNRQSILDAVQENDIAFREGFHDIFAVLAQQNVPTLIFSAGLYDVIHAVLDKEYAETPAQTLTPNVHVISNMMHFDENGTVVGFVGNLIHSLNKNASVLIDTPFWRQCQLEKRHNILLLGDSLGDASMADGLDYKDDEIVRIGFLNDRVDEKLDLYLQHFDVVLTNDSSLLPVELLLHQVQNIVAHSQICAEARTSTDLRGNKKTIVKMVHAVKEYFPEVSAIQYEGQHTKNVLAFQEYNADETILGKSMQEWCRFAVCYWHTFGGMGSDPFGPGTFTNRGWDLNFVDGNLDRKARIVEAAKCKADAAFELFTKLGVKYYTFHDHDLVEEGLDLAESQVFLDEITEYLLAKQAETGVKCLWGTSNLFGHRRFMNGASTNPDLAVFAHAAAHVKKAMEMTFKLGGENFVFWGGREGYQSILNTDTRKELDHMAAFFKMVVAYKEELGATFQLLIEPKPREPMKHQYDYDAATVVAFLHYYGLDKHFKLNIEPNHTTLAGHDYEHDIYYAADYQMLGSVDCNTGDPLLGWDTDQFLMDEKKALLVMKKIVEIGGLAPGGLNFDAKVRRESSDLVDLFIAHIGSMDCFARGLRQAAKLLEAKTLPELVATRYASWTSDLGKRIEEGSATLEEVAEYAKQVGEPKQISGKQELAEMLLFRSITE